MRIYNSNNQVIIATESGDEIGSISTAESAMTLYDLDVAITRGEAGGELVRVLYTQVRDANGALVGDKTEVITYLSEFIGLSFISSLEGSPVHTTPPVDSLISDAWGNPKVTIDHSILHGMFTYNVPVTMWYEKIDGVEQSAITRSQSVDGELYFTAGPDLNDECELRTFRNPRYQPNRGHLYSTAGFLDNPDAAQIREFGVFTPESGTFFRLEGDGSSHTLYGVTRTTVGGSTTEDTIEIDTTEIDLSKGNTFDIQFQWRGVGSYFFYINLDERGSFEYLGTLSGVSIYNPALPICFHSVNLGDNEPIRIGCVDVTSEGGEANGNTYGSIGISNNSGQVEVSTYNNPVIAVRSKPTTDGLINTRDTIALLASAYGDQRCLFRVWATRDFTAITENDQSWVDFKDGHLEYIEYDNPDVATPMTFDTSKATLVFGCRVDQDQTYSTSALFQGRTEIYITPSDMFVFTVHRETGGTANVGVTFEFAEAI